MTNCQTPETDSGLLCPEFVLASVAPEFLVRKMYVYGKSRIEISRNGSSHLSVHLIFCVRSQLQICQGGTDIGAFPPLAILRYNFRSTVAPA